MRFSPDRYVETPQISYRCTPAELETRLGLQYAIPDGLAQLTPCALQSEDIRIYLRVCIDKDRTGVVTEHNGCFASGYAWNWGFFVCDTLFVIRILSVEASGL